MNGKGSKDRVQDREAFKKRWDETCTHKPGSPGTTIYRLDHNGELVPKEDESIWKPICGKGLEDLGCCMDRYNGMVMRAIMGPDKTRLQSSSFNLGIPADLPHE